MARTVGHYHFAAWDLPTKYGWMHEGPGVSEGTRTQDLTKQMAERMISSGGFLRDLLGGAEWAGAAATAAGQAMQRGADQIDQTATGAATAERCVTELGESFVGAQHRVPSPNEIPSGLGDKFLFGAAAGFNAVSPFDVQSPIHAALEQRRELDEQANQALTDHMTTSRERLDTIPAVAAPPPMTVSTQSASVSGGGVGAPAGVGPIPSGTPSPVNAQLAAADPAWRPSVPSPGGAAPGLGPIPPGTPSPVNAGLAGTGPTYRPHPSGPGQFRPAAGPGPGQVPFAPGGGVGRAGGAAALGPGFGARPGAGGAGIPGRGAPGLGGAPGAGGGPVPGGSVESARGGGVRGGGSAGGRGAGAGSFMQPPIGGRGQGGEDTEHQDRYAQQADHIIGTLPLVAPAVIGETPEEEATRLRRAREET